MSLELSPRAKKVYEVMLRIGATSEDSLKSADKIADAVPGLGKGLVNAALDELVQKGVVKRVTRHKAAGYYIIKKLEIK